MTWKLFWYSLEMNNKKNNVYFIFRRNTLISVKCKVFFGSKFGENYGRWALLMSFLVLS
jgi:hypothetical protein